MSHAGKDPEIVSGGTVSEVGRGLEQRAAAVRASHRSPPKPTSGERLLCGRQNQA